MSQIEQLKVALQKGISMRAAQVEFFKNRDRDVLSQSKKLEREFDRLAYEALQETDLLG